MMVNKIEEVPTTNDTQAVVVADSFVDSTKEQEIARAIEKLEMLRTRAQMLAEASIKPNRKQRRAAATIARRDARKALKKKKK